MLIAIATLQALFWIIFLSNLAYLRRTRVREGLASSPRISILVPARNEAENLRRLLPSVLRQSYRNFELIIYDDDSTDETPKVVAGVSEDSRVRYLKGSGPDEGWAGKVHALYQSSRQAEAELFLFLDADVELLHESTLSRLVSSFLSLPAGSVMTGLTRLVGGGLLLVSLVPHTILTGLPWTLVRSVRSPALGALNGQCWMIAADTYRDLDPHRHVKGDILEDVQIGRYLKGKGLTPVMVDLTDHVAVHMYRDVRDAWIGFRKNAYLLLGGNVVSFVVFFVIFAAVQWLCAFVSPYLLLSAVLLKFASDRVGRFPTWVSILAPVSMLLSSMLQIDSALSHWTGNVSWKGRRMST